MANRFISGKDGAVDAGGILPVTEWSATSKTESVDRTNSKSGGFKTVSGGIRSASGSVKCHWDGDAGVPLVDGDEVDLKLYTEGTSSIPFHCAKALITELEVSLSINGGVDISFNFESNGDFTWP